jgi:hypothetical protein
MRGAMMPEARDDDDTAERIAALASLYESERSENLTLLNINMAFLGAVLAYVAASVAFLDQMDKLPRLAAALVPIPLWLGLMYSLVLVALSGRHGASTLILEEELFSYTGMDDDLQDHVGSRAGEYIVNPNKAPVPYRAVLWSVYIIPWLLTLLYTVYMLAKYVHGGWMLLVMIAFYASLAIIAGSAGLRAIHDTPEVPPPAKPSQATRRRQARRNRDR